MPAKLTQQNFINKANKKHNNFYDYSLVKYVNAVTKVKIICPKHGEFEQQPNNHLFGQGCIKCMGDNVRNARKSNHHVFINKLKNKQPSLYNHITFKSEYETSNKKMLLGSKYGDVLISPNKLLEGTYPNVSNSINPTEYIQNYIKYNYPQFNLKLKSKYINSNNKLLFESPYGDILLSYDSIIQGHINYNIGNAVNKHDYFLNMLKEKQPKYFLQNINFISYYKGNQNTIEFIINNIKYTSTPDTLLHGFFSIEKSKGRFNNTIIERNKLDFLNKFSILYKVRLYNNTENFYKIGITTNNLKQRMNSIPYNYEIVEIISTNLYDAYILEQDLHTQLSNFKYTPLIKFKGYTECFTNINK
jgi:hypothetical protein